MGKSTIDSKQLADALTEAHDLLKVHFGDHPDGCAVVALATLIMQEKRQVH